MSATGRTRVRKGATHVTSFSCRSIRALACCSKSIGLLSLLVSSTTASRCAIANARVASLSPILYLDAPWVETISTNNTSGSNENGALAELGAYVRQTFSSSLKDDSSSRWGLKSTRPGPRPSEGYDLSTFQSSSTAATTLPSALLDEDPRDQCSCEDGERACSNERSTRQDWRREGGGQIAFVADLPMRSLSALELQKTRSFSLTIPLGPTTLTVRSASATIFASHGFATPTSTISYPSAAIPCSAPTAPGTSSMRKSHDSAAPCGRLLTHS
eukprot:1500116-Rhodomonas_salina.1